jgi:hypothetical protein
VGNHHSKKQQNQGFYIASNILHGAYEHAPCCVKDKLKMSAYTGSLDPTQMTKMNVEQWSNDPKRG